jgi:ribosomal protein S18 acetylase RimI-like enzyme
MHPLLGAISAPETKMITIRQANLADIKAIQTLYMELDRHHVELIPGIFRTVEGDNRTDDSIAEWIGADDRTYLIAESSKRIVGFLSVAEKSYGSIPMHVPHRYGLIDNAMVHSGLRRRGVGARLFAAAIAWLQARGISSLQVQVWNVNEEAMNFYSKQGFSPMVTRMQMSLTCPQQSVSPEDSDGGEL